MQCIYDRPCIYKYKYGQTGLFNEDISKTHPTCLFLKLTEFDTKKIFHLKLYVNWYLFSFCFENIIFTVIDFVRAMTCVLKLLLIINRMRCDFLSAIRQRNIGLL